MRPDLVLLAGLAYTLLVLACALVLKVALAHTDTKETNR